MKNVMQTYFNPQAIPFWIVHLLALGAFVLPFDSRYAYGAVGLYFFRMFFITLGYHRYFSHRAFQTSRIFQFVIAFLAMTSAQKGVLWWAAHHRNHHRHSDKEHDLHSPANSGFMHAHMGWFLSKDTHATDYSIIKDYARYPELRFLNEQYWIPVLALIAAVTWLGGLQGFIWLFCVSTVVLWHSTFTINSLAHTWGRRDHETSDTSRNNFLLALTTLGEGWHNNHHKFPWSARSGMRWYEIDLTYYGMLAFKSLGIIWKLTPLRR